MMLLLLLLGWAVFTLLCAVWIVQDEDDPPTQIALVIGALALGWVWPLAAVAAVLLRIARSVVAR